MKPQSRLNAQGQEQEVQRDAAQQQSQEGAVLEFPTAEELLRHDALHTPVPPAIARRLQESLAQDPPPHLAWWRRLLRGL